MASVQPQQSQQSLKFSEIQRFRGGVISGSFVTKNDKPIQVKLENVVAPLGVSCFGDKKSIMLNIDEDTHDVNELLLVQAGAKEHPDLKDKNFNEIIKCSEKYGRQMKVSITPDTLFFNDECKKGEDTLCVNKCLVNILVEVNMVWVRGKECGISVKAMQIRHLKNITGGASVLPDTCLI